MLRNKSKIRKCLKYADIHFLLQAAANRNVSSPDLKDSRSKADLPCSGSCVCSGAVVHKNSKLLPRAGIDPWTVSWTLRTRAPWWAQNTQADQTWTLVLSLAVLYSLLVIF